MLSFLGDLSTLFKKLTRQVVIIFLLYIVAHILEAVALSMDVSRTDGLARAVIYGIVFLLGHTYNYFPPIAMGK